MITDAREWRDGFSALVMSHDIDGRLHITVGDSDHPGYTASFSTAAQAEIAAFIKGDE